MHAYFPNAPVTPWGSRQRIRPRSEACPCGVDHRQHGGTISKFARKVAFNIPDPVEKQAQQATAAKLSEKVRREADIMRSVSTPIEDQIRPMPLRRPLSGNSPGVLSFTGINHGPGRMEITADPFCPPGRAFIMNPADMARLSNEFNSRPPIPVANPERRIEFRFSPVEQAEHMADQIAGRVVYPSRGEEIARNAVTAASSVDDEDDYGDEDDDEDW